MLVRDLALLAIGVVAASQVPKLMPAFERGQPAAAAMVEKASTRPAIIPGSFTLEADRSGHFNGTFQLNGRAVTGLVDTGATFVALNEKTARQLGFTGNALDFRYAVNTANGPAPAAHVVLDRVEIGGLKTFDVEAFVLRDEALDGTLVGMSFLRKLKSYSVEDGKMIMKQ